MHLATPHDCNFCDAPGVRWVHVPPKRYRRLKPHLKAYKKKVWMLWLCESDAVQMKGKELHV